jgi:hypothetical protein
MSATPKDLRALADEVAVESASDRFDNPPALSVAFETADP